MRRRTWWSRATVAEKLAQIDAGLELGFGMGALALNLGVNRWTLESFCAYHGRRPRRLFRVVEPFTTTRRRQVRDIRRAYFEGAPVDFWAA